MTHPCPPPHPLAPPPPPARTVWHAILSGHGNRTLVEGCDPMTHVRSTSFSLSFFVWSPGVLRSQGHGLTSGQRIPPAGDTKSKRPRKLPAQPPPSTSLGTRDKNGAGSRVTPTRPASVLPATAGAAKPAGGAASVATWNPGTHGHSAPDFRCFGTDDNRSVVRSQAHTARHTPSDGLEGSVRACAVR